MARLKGFACSVAAGGLHGPNSPLTIETELLEPAVHGNAAAGRLDFTGGGFPHHAGAPARITKRFDQGFGAGAPRGLNPKERVAPSMSAFERLSPLIRWAAQSAEISSQSMPQTFSV